MVDDLKEEYYWIDQRHLAARYEADTHYELIEALLAPLTKVYGI